MIGLGLALQIFATAADGQAYVSQRQAIEHLAIKSATSLLVYKGLGLFHVGKGPRILIATAGTFLLAKGLELAKGHQLGPLDTIHDLAAHSLLVIPLATRKALPSISLGLILIGTCKQSSPKWC